MSDIVNKLKKSIWTYIGLLIVILSALGFGLYAYFSKPIVVQTDTVKTFDTHVSVLPVDDVYNVKEKVPYIGADMQKIKVAFTGDQGESIETKKAMQMIRQEAAELFVLLGDFDYKDNPGLWKKNLDEYLGVYFPVVSILGNHEEKLSVEYQKRAQEKIEQLPKEVCQSESKADLGLTYTCMFGPLRIVFVSPDIQIAQAQKTNPVLYIRNMFKKAIAGKVFIQESWSDPDKGDLETSSSDTASNDPWNVCAWHKVHSLMQLGTKSDKITWDIYEECRRFGAYIVAAHDHVFARSKTVYDFPGTIVSTSTDMSTVEVKPGSTGVSILGIGGKSVRVRERQGDVWWARTYTKEKLDIETGGKVQNNAGILFCTFDKTVDIVPCYFKTIDGVVRDEFVMKR